MPTTFDNHPAREGGFAPPPRDLVLLHLFTMAVGATLDLEQLYSRIQQFLTAELTLPAGLLMTNVRGDGALELARAWGLEDGTILRVLQERQRQWHQLRLEWEQEIRPATPTPPALPPLTATAASEGLAGHTGVLLTAGGDPVAVLDLFASTQERFDSGLLFLLNIVGRQGGTAVENALLYSQVRDGRRRLEALSRQLLEQLEAERRQTARELHDEIGQLLTGVKLALAASQAERQDPEDRHLAIAAALVDELQNRVRELSLDLRPALLDDLGLLPALAAHFSRYTAQTGIQVEFAYRGIQRRFPTDLETVAYRLIQEALTNVARHATAPKAKVSVRANVHTLGVRVRDSGAGFDVRAELTNPRSIGLAGLRERVLLVGGHLSIESAPGAGTTVASEFPLGSPVERRIRGRWP